MARYRYHTDELLILNLYDTQPPLFGETFTTLLEHPNITIMRIVSSDILPDTLYLQEVDEWVVVLEGEATVEIKGQERRLQKGDSLFIPAKTPHRVIQTQKGTLWLALYIKI